MSRVESQIKPLNWWKMSTSNEAQTVPWGRQECGESWVCGASVITLFSIFFNKSKILHSTHQKDPRMKETQVKSKKSVSRDSRVKYAHSSPGPRWRKSKALVQWSQAWLLTDVQYGQEPSLWSKPMWHPSRRPVHLHFALGGIPSWCIGDQRSSPWIKKLPIHFAMGWHTSSGHFFTIHPLPTFFSIFWPASGWTR